MDAALSSAISALNAQSAALSTISNNLANSSTNGYKASDTSFASLVAGTDNSASGGVQSSVQQSVNVQGTITSASSSTDLAIDGNGLFVVSNSSGSTAYTRDGAFETNASGYLVENGYTLMGWTTDSSGTITTSDTSSTSGLEAINVDQYSSSAKATSDVTLSANLPSDATAGATFTSSLSVYDSQGTAEEVPLTWTKSSTANEWTVTIGNPTNSSGTQSGTVGGTTSYTVDFNADGSLASISDTSGGTTTTVTSATITISSWNDGADSSSDGTISLDLGTSGGTDGLTQYASGATDPTIDVKSTTQNGYAYGTLSSVAVGTDGTVTATYSNGQSLAIAKVALATFVNPNGLQAQSDNVYTQTTSSGGYALHVAGTGGAGTIEGSSLEGSTTDTSTEMSKMIVAQEAYSAASQVITSAKAMFTSLIQAVG